MNTSRAPPLITTIKGGQFRLAKYIFSQGQVFVDEDAYCPILKKLETASKFSVLLIANGYKKAQAPPENKTNAPTNKQYQ